MYIPGQRDFREVLPETKKHGVYELTCSKLPVNGHIGQSSLERKEMKTDLTVNEYHCRV